MSNDDNEKFLMTVTEKKDVFNINEVPVKLPIHRYNLVSNLTECDISKYRVSSDLRIIGIVNGTGIVMLDNPINIGCSNNISDVVIGTINIYSSTIDLTTFNNNITAVIFSGTLVEKEHSQTGTVDMDEEERQKILDNIQIIISNTKGTRELTSILDIMLGNGDNREFKGKEIAQDIGEMLQKKNSDYGSAVYDDYKKLGIVSILTSLNHKMNRLITITRKGQCDVSNESFVDTLKDLAGYAICGLDAIGYHHDSEVK